MKFKRLVASILLACMTMTMVACSSDDGATTDTSGTVDTGVEATDDNPYGLKYDGMYSLSDEPITLTTFVHWNDSNVLTPDMPIPIELAAFTNVFVEGMAPEYNSSSTQAFNLLMTETVLPDIIGGDIVDINKYAADGAFIRLNELIDEYAPDIKAAFELYPEAQAAVTDENGDIFSIPFIYEEVISKAWFIRQDWLDNLGLEMPTTFDEFEAVLYAFRDDDPNGNGIADEIPMFCRKGSDPNKVTPYLQFFGVNAFWYVEDDGTIQIGMYTDEYKDAMIGVANWYSEGLIYEETFTTDSSARDLLFSGDTGGMTCDWIPSTTAFNVTSAKYVEDFLIVPMAPPEDINGNQWTAYSRARTEGTGWGISCDNEYPIETMKFMNFLFTEKGRDIFTYGVEGEHFNYNEDGDPIYVDSILDSDLSVSGQLLDLGGQFQTMAYLHDASYENQVMDAQGEAAMDMYGDYVNVYKPQVPSLSFTTEESDLISSVYPTCEAYMLEKAETWTYDGSRIEGEFDEYMATLASMGLDDVKAAYQAAYDRLLASVQ